MIAPCAALALTLASLGADARVDCRYSEVRLSIEPSLVEVGGVADLVFLVLLKDGCAWHSPRLAPFRVRLEPAAGWSADPVELELPSPESPREARGFTVRLSRTAEAPGQSVARVTLRYGVLRGGADGGIAFEEAAVDVELPRLERAAELPAGLDVQTSPLVASGDDGGKAGAEEVPRERSPLLPAIALAVSTGLLLGGIWLAVWRGRGDTAA